ncbi:MAG: uracil phosphoribosyltransferase [Acidimicrobiia bacterium]|nr:uracil phosphoribosyltransferase [Acidimicrobiia bacterium]
MTVTAAVGLGSNLSDRRHHLAAAIAALAENVGRVAAVSSVYETAPVGGPEQGDYLNAVALVETDLDPELVLEALLGIERLMGRERRERWGPRIIDLDLLLYGDRAVDRSGLTVPHPRMAQRHFVLAPLAEVWPHPVLPDGTVLDDALAATADQEVRRLGTLGGAAPYGGPQRTRRVMAGEVLDNVVVVDHPLVQHKLSLMRRKDTPTAEFRRLLREISALLGYEVTRDLPLSLVPIETPLAAMDAPMIEGIKPVIVSILRAGGGILEGMLDVLPAARVGHIGLYRDHETLEAIEYYFKMPDRVEDRMVIAVDPMLATGHSAVAAVNRIKARQPKEIRFVCLLAAPEGIAEFHRHHPDVAIWTAAIDSHLNDKGYIVPGLGDAGDRIFGTK